MMARGLPDERTLQVGPEYLVYCRSRAGSAGIDNSDFEAALRSRDIVLPSGPAAISAGTLPEGGGSYAFHVRLTEERTVLDFRQMIQNSAYSVHAWVPMDWVTVRALTGEESNELAEAGVNRLGRDAGQFADRVGEALPDLPNPLDRLPSSGTITTVVIGVAIIALVWFFAALRPGRI